MQRRWLTTGMADRSIELMPSRIVRAHFLQGLQHGAHHDVEEVLQGRAKSAAIPPHHITPHGTPSPRAASCRSRHDLCDRPMHRPHHLCALVWLSHDVSGNSAVCAHVSCADCGGVMPEHIVCGRTDGCAAGGPYSLSAHTEHTCARDGVYSPAWGLGHHACTTLMPPMPAVIIIASCVIAHM